MKHTHTRTKTHAHTQRVVQTWTCKNTFYAIIIFYANIGLDPFNTKETLIYLILIYMFLK